MSEFLPFLAEVVEAKPPRRVPRWLGRLIAGEWAVVAMTELRGSSNEKAKRELAWQLRFPSWRQGFFAAHASPDRHGRRGELREVA